MTTAAAASPAGLDRFIVPLASAAATDAERVGPKAANLAALARAGLPTPGGFCLTADAYRAQIATLGLTETLARFAAADRARAAPALRRDQARALRASRSSPHILDRAPRGLAKPPGQGQRDPSPCAPRR